MVALRAFVLGLIVKESVNGSSNSKSLCARPVKESVDGSSKSICAGPVKESVDGSSKSKSLCAGPNSTLSSRMVALRLGPFLLGLTLSRRRV